MKQCWKKIAALVVCLAFVFSAGAVTSLADSGETAVVHFEVTYGQTEARSMLDMVNEFRTGSDAWAWNEDNTTKTTYSGLNELVYDYELEAIAMQRATEIALACSHTRPNGTSWWTLYNSYYSCGENIAAGYRTAQAVFEGWQETNEDYSGQGHRRNMLSDSYTAIGIGHVYVNGTHYWVQEFRNPASDAAAVKANDAKTTVDVEILLSDAAVTAEAEPTSLTVTCGQTAPLPALCTTVQMTDAWPARASTVTADAVWAVEDAQYAGVSAQEVTGLKAGRTTLVATVLGQQVSVPLTVTEPVTAPAAPEILSVYSRLQNTAKVTWTNVDGADGYELFRALDPDTDPEKLSTNAADENNGMWVRVKTITDQNVQYTDSSRTALCYTNQGLTVGRTCYYMIRAFAEDAGGNRLYSDFSNVDYMPAAVVFDQVYSNATNRIRLTWNEVGGATGYQIWRQNEDGTYSIVKTLGDKGNTLTDNQGGTTAYSNTGLEAGKTCTYRMRAFAIVEDGVKVFGAYSDPFTVAVMPEAPAMTATAGSRKGRAELSWNAVNGAAGYQVWMSESVNGGYTLVKSITDGATTSYTKYDLTSGKTYYFKVRAYTEVDGKKTFGTYSDARGVTVR